MSFQPQESEQDRGFYDDAKTYVLPHRESYALIFCCFFSHKFACVLAIDCGFGKLRKVHHLLLGICLGILLCCRTPCLLDLSPTYC